MADYCASGLFSCAKNLLKRANLLGGGAGDAALRHPEGHTMWRMDEYQTVVFLTLVAALVVLAELG